MNAVSYPLLIVPVFLLGFFSMFLYFPYPEPDIDAMREFIKDHNAAHDRAIFSEQRGPMIIDVDYYPAPSIEIHMSCDTPPESIRLFTRLFDSNIPMYFRAPIIFSGGHVVEHDWDTTPCFSPRE